MKLISLSLTGILALVLCGCAGLVSGSHPPPPPIQLTISPPSATVQGTAMQQFTAQVSDGSSPALTWSVNGVAGGTAATGTINATGLYTAPEFPPAPNSITVGAAETAKTAIESSVPVMLDNPVPQITSVSPTQIPVGNFTLTVSGAHFATNATILFGATALTTTRASSTQLSAAGTASSGQIGNVSITVQNPAPGPETSGALTALVVGNGPIVSQGAAVRFLEESTYGPTPELVSQVQLTGFDPFLQGQMTAATSTYPAPAATDMGLGKVQNQFFLNGVLDSDQLRQRRALNEIWVVGENKVSDPTGYANYMQALTNDALGNYYDVMKDVTLTPAMGHWLDMVTTMCLLRDNTRTRITRAS